MLQDAPARPAIRATVRGTSPRRASGTSPAGWSPGPSRPRRQALRHPRRRAAGGSRGSGRRPPIRPPDGLGAGRGGLDRASARVHPAIRARSRRRKPGQSTTSATSLAPPSRRACAIASPRAARGRVREPRRPPGRGVTDRGPEVLPAPGPEIAGNPKPYPQRTGDLVARRRRRGDPEAQRVARRVLQSPFARRRPVRARQILRMPGIGRASRECR